MGAPFWSWVIVAAPSVLPWLHSSMLEDNGVPGGGAPVGGPPALPNTPDGFGEKAELEPLLSSPASSFLLSPPPKKPAAPWVPPHLAHHATTTKLAASAVVANDGRLGAARGILLTGSAGRTLATDNSTSKERTFLEERSLQT